VRLLGRLARDGGRLRGGLHLAGRVVAVTEADRELQRKFAGYIRIAADHVEIAVRGAVEFSFSPPASPEVAAVPALLRGWARQLEQEG
jgi:hypothetical protein